MKEQNTQREWAVDGYNTSSVIEKQNNNTWKHIYDCNYGYEHPAENFDFNHNNAKLIAQSPAMLQFITEIQQALTDKAQGGTKLSVLEHSMLNQANEILNKVK